MKSVKNIAYLLIALFSVVLFSNFQCDDKIEYEGEITYLSYGTSFGMCAGYCVREVVVSGGITFTKSDWKTSEPLPDSTCELTFIQSPLPGYLDEIELDSFLVLDQVIGCPDCADGGAEWLELGFENGAQRVTFEYMNEPEVLSEIVTSLRELMESFNDCRGDS